MEDQELNTDDSDDPQQVSEPVTSRLVPPT